MSMRADLSVAIVGAAALASALSSCAGGGDGPAAPSPVPAAAAGDGLDLGTLAARDLGSGQCGLFLWTRTQDPQLVFFSNPETGEAAVVVDGRERALRRLGVDGPTTGGRGAQSFATATGDVSARLTIQETEPVQNGYRVASASLRVTVEDGWSGVIATAGLAACQP
jgi:hypothetical protein